MTNPVDEILEEMNECGIADCSACRRKTAEAKLALLNAVLKVMPCDYDVRELGDEFYKGYNQAIEEARRSLTELFK